MAKVGNEGAITVEEAKTLETELEVVEGMQFGRRGSRGCGQDWRSAPLSAKPHCRWPAGTKIQGWPPVRTKIFLTRRANKRDDPVASIKIELDVGVRPARFSPA